MLIRPELIEHLAETLEAIPMTLRNGGPADSRHEVGLLIYRHQPGSTSTPIAGESPLLDITIIETDVHCSLLVNSALGMLELHNIDEIRLQESTAEAAFYSHNNDGTITMATLSSHGVVQVYVNVAESLVHQDVNTVADEDLRAAVALKIFDENSEVFQAGFK